MRRFRWFDVVFLTIYLFWLGFTEGLLWVAIAALLLFWGAEVYEFTRRRNDE